MWATTSWAAEDTEVETEITQEQKSEILKAELTLSQNKEVSTQDAIETKTVGNFITIITSYLLIGSTLIGVGMFTYASYQLFTSEGDSKRHGEAIKGLMYSAVAFLVIFLSYTVVEVASRYSFS